VGRKKIFGFGKHVGGKGLKAILDALKIEVTEEEFMAVFNEIKRMGDSGKSVTDADLLAIVRTVKGAGGNEFLKLKDLKISSGTNVKPSATVVVEINGKEATESAEGNGPVNAAISAIMNAVGDKTISLEEYHVDAITGGTDANVSVTVRMKSEDKVITASGVDCDIITASVEAIISGINGLKS